MFRIISLKPLELFPSSKVALHFNVNYWRPYWVVNCSEAALSAARAARVMSVSGQTQHCQLHTKAM